MVAKSPPNKHAKIINVQLKLYVNFETCQTFMFAQATNKHDASIKCYGFESKSQNMLTFCVRQRNLTHAKIVTVYLHVYANRKTCIKSTGAQAHNKHYKLTCFSWIRMQIVKHAKALCSPKLQTIMSNINFHWNLQAISISRAPPPPRSA